MSSILNEFKAFAVKGNAVDMAVGVIIGGAGTWQFQRVLPTPSVYHTGCSQERGLAE